MSPKSAKNGRYCEKCDRLENMLTKVKSWVRRRVDGEVSEAAMREYLTIIGEEGHE